MSQSRDSNESYLTFQKKLIFDQDYLAPEKKYFYGLVRPSSVW